MKKEKGKAKRPRDLLAGLKGQMLDFKQVHDGDVLTYDNGEVGCSICCDCSLRHIELYKVKRGKTPEDDKVEVMVIRDDWGTELLRKVYGNGKCRTT